MFKKLSLILLPLLTFSFTLTGCSPKNPQLSPPKKGEDIAIIETNMGTIKAKFFPKYAPKTVENFLTHSKNGYYDGLIFHRVMDDFMIQGGDPQGTGSGGESIWGKPFEDEFSENLKNYRGALSMANNGPNTNSSQFFIVQAKSAANLHMVKDEDVKSNYKNLGGTPWLDNMHTVFGQVFEGMDVVDKIAAVDTNNSKPVEDVKIIKITVEKY